MEPMADGTLGIRRNCRLTGAHLCWSNLKRVSVTGMPSYGLLANADGLGGTGQSRSHLARYIIPAQRFHYGSVRHSNGQYTDSLFFRLQGVKKTEIQTLRTKLAASLGDFLTESDDADDSTDNSAA
jgi:hypothetical protein